MQFKQYKQYKFKMGFNTKYNYEQSINEWWIEYSVATTVKFTTWIIEFTLYPFATSTIWWWWWTPVRFGSVFVSISVWLWWWACVKINVTSVRTVSWIGSLSLQVGTDFRIKFVDSGTVSLLFAFNITLQWRIAACWLWAFMVWICFFFGVVFVVEVVTINVGCYCYWYHCYRFVCLVSHLTDFVLHPIDHILANCSAADECRRQWPGYSQIV